jgi:hypothetical protein
MAMLRTGTLVVSLTLAAAAIAQNSDAEKLPALKVADDVFLDCIRNWLEQRIDWMAAPSEMADAALSACMTERQAIENAAAAVPGKTLAEAREYASRHEEDARRLIVEIMVEAQNSPRYERESNAKQ